MPGTRTSLDSLPNDVQQMIFSYLSKPLSGYALDGMPRNINIFRQLECLQPTTKDLLRTHPFQNLAATCKPLRAAVEGYCKHLLNRHSKLMAIRKMPELDDENWEELAAKNCKRKKTKARRETYRNLWVRKSHERCVWCGRKSKRRAVFDLLVYCCNECDEKIYGKRLSRTAVNSQYKIKPLHYLYPSHVFTGSGFKPLSTAMRAISGGLEATYLLEEEVKPLAEYAKVHDPKGLQYRFAVKKFGRTGGEIQDAKRDEDNCKNILFWGIGRYRLPVSRFSMPNLEDFRPDLEDFGPDLEDFDIYAHNPTWLEDAEIEFYDGLMEFTDDEFDFDADDDPWAAFFMPGY